MARQSYIKNNYNLIFYYSVISSHSFAYNGVFVVPLLFHNLPCSMLPVREGEMQEVEACRPGGYVESVFCQAVQRDIGDGLSQVVVCHDALDRAVAGDGEAVRGRIGKDCHMERVALRRRRDSCCKQNQKLSREAALLRLRLVRGCRGLWLP